MGNIRVTVNDIDSIVTKDDYYPFGLQMPDMSFNNGNTNDRLKYSGKELDEEGGLHKYHFGWRDYDPAIARWYVVDPKQNDYPSLSPYNYVLNNPVRLFDIKGLNPDDGNAFDDNQSAADPWQYYDNYSDDDRQLAGQNWFESAWQGMMTYLGSVGDTDAKQSIGITAWQNAAKKFAHQNTIALGLEFSWIEKNVSSVTPIPQNGLKKGSYNRLLEKGVYDGADIVKNTFWTRFFPGGRLVNDILSDSGTQAALLLIGLGAYSYGPKLVTTALRISQRMSWFYLRNKYTVDVVGLGVLEGFPGFPSPVFHIGYGVGIGAGTIIYEAIK